MSSALSLARELLLSPQIFFRRLETSRDAVRMALVTIGLMVLYHARTTGLSAQIRYLLGPTGHWDRNSLFYLLSAVQRSIVQAVAVILLFAGVTIPVALMVASRLHPRKTFTGFIRDNYCGVLATSLAAWSLSVLVMIIPSLLLFPATSPTLTQALQVAPLPTFTWLMVIGLGEQLRLRRWSAVAVSVASVPPLVFVPFLGALLVLILYSPLFAVIIFLLVRELIVERLARQRRAAGDASSPGVPIEPSEASVVHSEGRHYESTPRS